MNAKWRNFVNVFLSLPENLHTAVVLLPLTPIRPHTAQCPGAPLSLLLQMGGVAWQISVDRG